MYLDLDGAILASKVLEHPEEMDLIDDPFVLIKEDPSFWRHEISFHRHKEMLFLINMLYGRGWEIVNTGFYAPNLMATLFKNPRAKRKNMGGA